MLKIPLIAHPPLIRDMIESPCINVCTLDARSRRCLGCGRTIDEISHWTSLTEAERTRIMGELAGRLSAPGGANPVRATG
jgi:predicted Fe-S protein YdhL (DUF1289 family)